MFDAMVAAAYERGKALNISLSGDVDDVIDPADTRRWILAALECHVVSGSQRRGQKRPFVSMWLVMDILVSVFE